MKAKSMENLLLAADIGGTKTLLGLFEPAEVRPRPVVVRAFGTLDYADLNDMISEFIKFSDLVVDHLDAFAHPKLHQRGRQFRNEASKQQEFAAVLVLAQTLGPREDALHRLARELVLGGPAALALAILAGYLLAAAALRPVEAMRRRAAAITASTPGMRLPVPPGRDEISKLAETLNDMLGRLEAAFEHERRFVADASHELRTPLALLRTELELALRRPRSHDELEEALRSAAEDTERLTHLAEDLLLIARSDQGELPLRRVRVSAREVLEDVAARFEEAARARGRSVAVSSGTDAFVDADPARLEQALGNLVDNALVYGDGAVELFVVNGAGVELHVADEGPGFPLGFSARAFDRFSRADEARSPGGAGLGLAIVEVIARTHGGSATVANRDGRGADAWITLGNS